MTRFAAVLSVLALALPLAAAPRTTHEGTRWVLENQALRVEVDAQGGTFQVLDRRAGYLWRGPDAGPTSGVMLLVPQAAQPVEVDGVLSEWADRGALLEIMPHMVADARKVDGPADCSARVRLLWDAGSLVLAADVKDEKVVFPTADEAQWWEKDSVEFWLGDTQYALRLTEGGGNLWSSTGTVSGARIAHRRTPGGYQVEARLPLQLLKASATAVGGQFRFAVGINDCDGAGREAQLYYPLGWAHSNPNTFAQATLADAQGAVPTPGAAAPAGPAFQPAGDRPGEASFKLQIKSGGKTFPGTLTFRLLGDTPELQLVLDADDRTAQTGRFGVLHPLVLDRPGRILGAQYCNGIGVPTDDMTWRGRLWGTGGVLDMPWVGLTDGKLGYMLLWELPASCDNGEAVFETVKAGQSTLLAPGVQHDPIRGRFAEPRVVRYSFCADGGHVAICKRFRDYIKGQGMLVTQKEKLRKKPQLANLLGAPDIWGRSDLRFCQEARAAGIDRMLLNSPQSAADMEKIKAMGFLMGRYDNYEDAYEGDGSQYGDFVEADDVVIQSNGDRMKAWLTKGDKPKQFMKRCSALYEAVARKWVPKDLAIYPYNTRFIDVTTATGLRECYHEKHPLDRTQDREVNRKLARYMGDELGLVLGGEHGRWWGADIYNYWEGMQSGGFYSWPAGHVGLELPQTREAIGDRYLQWGLGEKHRYPLWELVYHDCVVSTWYWGDSTGHLQAVAPDLGVKQDAFNVLYGTVPLYWVAQPYSYNWSKPELRARLLESYRNTCKLHEKIGFEEMVSHEFVTADRAVQHTVFGDGTNVWVNFGEKPWTLQQGAKSWQLPQYGFYAKGPRIEQYRALQGDRTVTCIHGDNYLYASESIPRLIEFSGGGVTCKVEAPGRLRVSLAPDTKGLRLNVRALCPGKSAGPWHILTMSPEAEPEQLVTVPAGKGTLMPIETQGREALTLVAPEALADHAELQWQGLQPWGPGPTKQGLRVAITGNLRNVGGKAARQATVRLVTRTATPQELGTQRVDLPPGATKAVSFQFDSTQYDGDVPLALEVATAGKELCLRDNRLAFSVPIAPNWTLWDGHLDLTVKAEAALHRPLARVPFDMAAERMKLGLKGDGDPDSLRVVLTDSGAQCLAQLVPSLSSGTELVFQLPRDMQPGNSLACRVYFDRAVPKRHRQTAPSCWQADRTTYDNGTYSVQFAEGYIRAVRVGPLQVMTNLGTSSKDTGWVDEQGEVQSFDVLSDGPICTIIRVQKKMANNHAHEKLYTFTPDYFTVQVLSSEIYGTMSRAYYMADADYEDDKGNKARIDGKGDAENVSGKNPGPQWYATWGPTWAINGIPVTPFANVGYWDGGSKAGLGFSGGQTKPGQTVAYFIHVLKEGTPPATELARSDRQQMLKPLVVTRQ
ncbi:hypothetical protein LLH23_12280 [bacterium]|nr:hypothetical protein [bacterium]